MLKLLLFVTILNLAIFAQSYSEPGGCEKKDESAAIRLKNANTQVTGECLHDLNRREPGKTKIVSLAFVLSTLAQLVLYVYGSTFSKILRILNLENKQKIKETFPVSLKKFNSVGNSKFTHKTKLYVDKEIKYTNKFEDSYEQIFYGKTDQLDFSKPNETAHNINNWVDCQICNLADDTISSDAIHKGMGMVFVDTFEVLVNLSNKLIPTCTTDIDFHSNKHQTIKVPAILRRGPIKYGKIGKKAEGYLIPFENNKNSLLLVNPNDINGLSSVLGELRDHRDFNAAVNGLKYTNLSLTFPLIKIKTKHDFVECFKSTGILPELFRPHGAKFKNVFTNEDCVHISNLLQEISLKIGTGLKTCDTDLQGCPHSGNFPVHAINQPFLFYILCDKKSPMIGGIWHGDSIGSGRHIRVRRANDGMVLKLLENGLKKLSTSDSYSLLKSNVAKELTNSLKKNTSYGSTLVEIIESTIEN